MLYTSRLYTSRLKFGGCALGLGSLRDGLNDFARPRQDLGASHILDRSRHIPLGADRTCHRLLVLFSRGEGIRDLGELELCRTFDALLVDNDALLLVVLALSALFLLGRLKLLG